MSPQRRALVRPEHQQRLLAAQKAKDAAEPKLCQAATDALLAGGSIREVAALLGMSTNSIERWGREGGWPSAEQKAKRAADRARNAELNRQLGLD